MKKSIDGQQKRTNKDRKVSNNIDNEDHISDQEVESIQVNQSPKKKFHKDMKKIHINIDSYESNESQILDQHDENNKNGINKNISHSLTNHRGPHLTKKQSNKTQRATDHYLSPLNRLTKISSHEFGAKEHFNQPNQYNETLQQRNFSRKILTQYLKNVGCRAEDYVQIKLNNMHGFFPVYKIINLKQQANNPLESKQRKASDDIIIENNSFLKNKSKMSNNSKGGHRKSISEVIGSSQGSLELTMGSKIFLKHEKFNHVTPFSINKLNPVPSLESIYVYLEVNDLGYLVCTDNSLQSQGIQPESKSQQYLIEFQDFQQGGQKVQAIWRCVLAEGYKKYFDDHITEEEITLQEQEQKYIVRLTNFHTGKYLSMNDQKQFVIDEFSEKGSRFILKSRLHQNNDDAKRFTLEKVPQTGRDYESSKNRQHISYQQSKKHYGQVAISSQPVQIQLRECQQSVITLQQQLLYIKNKLRFAPSLKLIEVILQTMIPYSIPEFTHNIHIVSQYIQKVFYDQKISHLMAEYLLEYLEKQKDFNVRQGLSSIREADEVVEESQGGKVTGSVPSFNRLKLEKSQKRGSVMDDNKKDAFVKVIKYINRLCLNSKPNSEIFISLLDLMFSHPLRFYEEIISLVQNNIYFVCQFYKREWYQKIIRAILTHSIPDKYDEQGYEPYFIIIEKFCVINRSSQIQNQFLIFHTIKQPQFQAKNILLNLYVEGHYIFVRESNKDMELMTYLESKQLPEMRSRQASSIINRNSQGSDIQRNSLLNQGLEQRNSKRFSILQKSSTFLVLLHKIVLHLQVLQMLGFGYNYTILRRYKPIMEKLLSYCNKQQHLVIKDYDFTRWVLKCANCFYQPEYSQLTIFPRFKLGIVDSPTGQSKFKQKVFNNQFFPIVLAGLGQIKADNNTPRISQRQALQICNIFLAKCREYYMQVKAKNIKINEIFSTKAIMGEPIQEYFDFLKLLFSNRLLKFKQKKKAQFMQYLQKLFENVFPQNDKVEQSEQTLMIIFVKLLLRIISFDEKYENYLDKLKITPSYHENILPNNLIKTKKLNVKKLSILNSNEECSKIMRIKLLNAYFEKIERNKKADSPEKIQEKERKLSVAQKNDSGPMINGRQMFRSFEGNKQGKSLERKQTKSNEPTHTNMSLVNTLARTDRINDNSTRAFNGQIMMSANENIDTSDLLQEYESSQQIMSLKKRSLELLILILLNVNQEYIQESIETLNYFIKNPTILNMSSFELFSSVPKYENEFGIRRRIIEQWYLVSDPETFELLTTVLRLLHRKVSIHINRISSVEVIADSDLSQISTYIADNMKEVQKMSKCINTWFKEQLFSQSSESFNYFDEKLQNIAESLNQTKELKSCGCVSIPFQIKRILISLSCLDWIKRVLSHIAKEFKSQQNRPMKGLGYNKTRLAMLKTYNKTIRSYTQKVCQILDFLVEPLQIQRLKSEQQECYQTEFETNLQYIQAILYLLGQNLSQIPQARRIVIKILEIGLIFYDINLVKYLSNSTIRNLLQCKQSIFELLNIITNFKDYQKVKIATQINAILDIMDQKKLEELTYLWTTNSCRQKGQKHQTEHLLQNCNQIQQREYQNSWFYFISRLNQIRKKFEVESSFIPLLKLFYSKILFIVLENEIRVQFNEDLITKSKKSHNSHTRISLSDLKRIYVQIQRKKYLAHFIAEYVDSQTNIIPKILSSKKKESLLQENKKEKQFSLIRQHVTKSLTDISFYDKIQKFATSQGLSQTKTSKNSVYNQLQSLIHEYLEYYIYDLSSLLFLLESTQDFEKIHQNLTRLNQKLRSFLIDKTAQRIETHYTQDVITKIIKQLQERIRFVKGKSPRVAFDQTGRFQFFNLRAISFMQPKQIKKLQSTALRKWKKAVKILETSALAAETDFLYEVDHFADIYNIKNKEELNAVINNEDLLKKLVSVATNLKRVIKSAQNKIFVLSQLNKLIQSKYFEHLVNIEEGRETLALMILEQLYDDEIGDQKHNNYAEDSEKWTENIFVVCLKLDIIRRLEYFAHSYYKSSLEILIPLMKKARRLFFSDSMKIRIAQNEFRDVSIELQPFYLILSIISEQIVIQSLGENAEDIIGEVYATVIEHIHFDEYQWTFNPENKINFKYGTHRRIQQKIVQKLSKYPKTPEIITKISQKYKNVHLMPGNETSASEMSYHLLEKMEMHNQTNLTNSKEKGWNFLVMMGLGAYNFGGNNNINFANNTFSKNK